MYLQYRHPCWSDAGADRHVRTVGTKLRGLTDNSLRKLGGITDEQFAELELVPDFDTDE